MTASESIRKSAEIAFKEGMGETEFKTMAAAIFAQMMAERRDELSAELYGKRSAEEGS